MANNFDSNFTRKVMREFLKPFDSSRVLTKNINTQLFQGKFTPASGTTIDVKRPTDYISTRTSDGDITGTRMPIITGKASATVQDYFTVVVDYDEADEATKMDQLEELLAPKAQRIVTDLELDFANYMRKNAGLLAGTYGTAVSAWDHVAEAGAVMQASGIPMDETWCYAVNPFTQRSLASNQRSLGAASPLVKSSHEKAIISDNFAGMRVMTATTLGSATTHSASDRAGTINGSPTVTYVGAKDTMTQVIPVTGFNGGSTMTVSAGEVIQIAGRNRLNLSTRQPIVDENGDNILFTGVVTEDATLTSGAGNLTISGPAIYEASGAYNTVDSALTNGDVVTLLGSASTLYQPNLFWHKQAFTMTSVPIKKLHSTDTIATTKDGLQFRVSKYADGDANKQIIRIDFRPAYGVLNPFFAGQGWGRS